MLFERDLLNGAPLRLLHELQNHVDVGVGRLGDHLLRAVVHLPALRKVDAEPQRRMQEGVAAHDPLLGIVAVDDAVDVAKELVTVGREVRAGPP